ncbi:hypothetical protein [Isoptericola chiayiensis]|nr:hypothetical protein [Isoptericola chiayiensis]NOW02075.1 hypothetical protein [Isoptericola chiayiensis]
MSRDPQGRAVARSARLAIGGNDLAHLHMPCRATQWALVLDALVRLPDSAMGGARAAAEALLFTTRTQLVISSVTALDRPSPSFGQHVASYWPGATFVVDLAAGTVGPFRRSIEVPPHGVVLARSGRQVVPDGVVRALPSPLLEIRVPGTEWKARRWLEVTGTETSPEHIVATALNGGTWARCSVCGRSGLSARCLFCEVDLPGAATAGVAAATSQGVLQ